MPDRFGPRGTIAIIIPLQNANMQPEFGVLQPAGINNQIYRFDIAAHDSASNAILDAVPGALLCWPDMIVSAVSLEMHNWSRDKQDAFRVAVAERSQGTPFTLATDATEAALRTLGAKRIGILAPMSAEHSKVAQAYYEAAGFEVPYTTSLEIKRSEDIIKATIEQIQAGFAEIDHPDIDTLVHVGGALGVVGMINELESRFAKPVVSVNAATYWYALRRLGIADEISGVGQLLRQPEITG